MVKTGVSHGLTKNFAGIGTRDIELYNKQDKATKQFVPNPKYLGKDKEQKAIQAIRDVYTKTFGSKPTSQPIQLNLFEQTGTINVYSSDNNGYQSLSNFSIRPFTLKQKNGTTVSFQSVEQAFQFSKAMYFANNSSVATKIMFSTNSAEIKQLGTTVPMTAEQIQKWNQFSTGLMHRLMLQSFMQNESAKQLLLSTGDAKIAHQRNGVEQDNGRFSKLLEQVRNEIRMMENEGNEHKNNC